MTYDNSITFGRHPAVQDIEYVVFHVSFLQLTYYSTDLADALEIDDEFWSLEPNTPPPVQPPGVLSRLTVFNQVIGLARIAGRCLQTVVCPLTN